MSKAYMVDITENISDIQIKNLKTLKENASHVLIPESVMENIINNQSNRFLESPSITEEEIAIIKNYVFNNSKLKKWTNIDEISDAYIKNLYKINMWSTVIRVLQNEHIHNIDQQKLNKYYSIFVKEFNNIVSIASLTYFIPTPHLVYNAANKKLKGVYSEIKKPESKILFRDIIKNDELLSEEEKQNLLQGKNPSNAINKWLGIKLKKNEKRVLRALRRIVYQKIVEGSCIAGAFTYDLEHIPLVKIYEECGIKPLSNNVYDYNQTKPIQNILSNSLLKKDILIKDNSNLILKTSFIPFIKFNFIETKKGKQNISVSFSIPKFLFIDNKMKGVSYYNQDHVAYTRFMQQKGMVRNDVALDLFEYLELIVNNTKTNIIEVNLTTIIKELNIEKKYGKNPKRERENIHKILNVMVTKKCFIKNWRIKKGKHNQDKYIFEPIIVNHSTKTKKLRKNVKNNKQNKLRA